MSSVSGAPRAAVPVGLTSVAIVERALELIDRDGLDVFSVRTLARELSVNPTAITWHVGTRDQLLSAVGQFVLSDLERLPRRGAWEQRIRTIARRFRSAVHAHPNTAPLIGTRLTSNMGDHLPILEALLEALEGAGLAGRRQRNTLNALLGAVLGFVAVELATPPDDIDQFEIEVRSRGEAADPARLPRFVAQREALANRSFVYRWTSGAEAPLDDAFETMLDLMLEGITTKQSAGGDRVTP
jgi:TetR/AcrR family transcriptional regulator, tetracycline repressor protein